MLYVAYVVLFLSLINLFRMATFLVGSDVYDILNVRKEKIRKRKSKHYFSSSYQPLVTIIVPARNEEKILERTLSSIINTSYRNFELIIVNDSSTDKTGQIARNFQRKFRHQIKKIVVLNVKARGKAKALNAGLKYAHGSLYMCLDADSALAPNALREAVACFREKSLGALAANIKIFPGTGILNLLQRIEYLVGYQMKKAETLIRTQYIIGGIGSMYRMKIIQTLGLYETDTLTEDIDLSMKLIENYGKEKYIGYHPLVIVYTEAVMNVPDLIKQRFRWKYGRYQVFLKRHKLFWSLNTNKNLLLSWVYLPYALFAELAYTLEPLTIILILYLIFSFGNYSMVIGSFLAFCFYSVIQVTGATQSYSKMERIKLLSFAPLAYIFMYALSYVEYIATWRGLLNFKKLLHEYHHGGSHCEWTHVARQDRVLTGLNK